MAPWAYLFCMKAKSLAFQCHIVKGFKMSKRDSPEASSQYIQGDEIPGDEVQYLQYTIQSASSREDRKHNTVNEISVIKTVGTWTKTPDSFQETVGSSFQSGKPRLALWSMCGFYETSKLLRMSVVVFKSNFRYKRKSKTIEYLTPFHSSSPSTL